MVINSYFILKIILIICSSLLILSSGIYYYITIYQQSSVGKINHQDKIILLFDFDGTICDSLNSTITAYNTLATDYPSLTRIAHQDIDKYRNLEVQQFLKMQQISKWKLPFIAYKLRKMVKNQPIDSPFAGAAELLHDLKQQGYVIGILTSNSLQKIEDFFKTHNMPELDFIYSGSSTFGKASILAKIKELSKTNKMIYIADEVRDIQACKETNIQIIAVSWGYNAKKLLMKHNPDFIADSFQEVKEIIKNTSASH